MQIVELLFKCKHDSIVRHSVEEAIREAVLAFRNNGQIVDRDLAITRVPEGYKAVVAVPESKSLQPSVHSRHVRASLHRLRKNGITGPRRRSLGMEYESGPVCRCRRFTSLILQPNCSRQPVRCGDCFGFVPFYRFRSTDGRGRCEDILHWQRRYDLLDDLWIDSGAGEMFAYRQLSRPDSDLSKEGRAVCRRIEQQGKVPTYYCLYHYSMSDTAASRRRRCPACGRKWLLPEPWHWYDCRCVRCRLVS